MSEDNVIELNENIPTDANSTLEYAKNKFSSCVVIGWDKEHETIRAVFSKGMTKHSDVILALERAKHEILSGNWSG